MILCNIKSLKLSIRSRANTKNNVIFVVLVLKDNVTHVSVFSTVKTIFKGDSCSYFRYIDETLWKLFPFEVDVGLSEFSFLSCTKYANFLLYVPPLTS